MARRAPRYAEAERNDRALLEAAKKVLAVDGAHTSVAAIAARAGVGIASLYRRYRTKEELFQHLCALSLGQWIQAAEEGLAHEDAWEGLVHYVTSAIEFSGGALGPLAGTIPVTAEMAEKFTRSEELTRALVARAHEAGVLRPDATTVDVSLLIEQLGKASLAEQFEVQGRDDLVDAARDAHRRIIAIALDGLRTGHGSLPGMPPGPGLLAERW
ncbi:TetR/AcrR family transcriptional regulator [Streptomyces sp. NBC_00094]|uniref:TetR/AcrR family transcriptional regulator n=1 Tax=Streptomyces sp. NBC_00094 TaxID=2903620 RepID=UPI002256B7D6|nr:TetR/AcrR family transcriptional regulator [Streptomyces sp. NBC_00094]MCX5393903.1 TetR/AcrR family transcriptional regulator [Streptomyces sp. NBC_00094]